MSAHQPGITADLPPVARFLSFAMVPNADVKTALRWLAQQSFGESAVVGLGARTVAAAGGSVDGLREPQPHSGPDASVPATPTALWIWLRDSDRGELVHRARRAQEGLSDAFVLEHSADAFLYRSNRDLGGYEDGTENPKGDDALRAAISQGGGPGLAGSSFVAVQTWLHDLGRFEAMTQTQRDHTFGRRLSDNEEIDEAPESAHVKRTAQESFEPEAFVLRRSMPWSEGDRAGLVFVAFGRRFDAFEALLSRMVGEEDGIADALFTFTRPIDSRYLWCPPMRGERLDLSALLGD